MPPLLHRLALLLALAPAVVVLGARRHRGGPPAASPSQQPQQAQAKSPGRDGPSSSPVPMHNWGWSYEFNVAKLVKPASREELAAVIRDPHTYPSPVRALGNAHSVTECVVSNGTVVDMRGFDQILGNDTDARGRMVVSVEAGVPLIKLYEWLMEKGLELPFAAEIGDATVGSLTSSLSKDSGLGDPALSGTLYKALVGVTYLDHEGREATLRDTTNGTALARFKCSEGLLGIVVQVDLITRPARLVRFANKVVPTPDLLAAVHRGGLQVSDRQNWWLVLHPDFSFAQERAWAEPEATESDAQTLGTVCNATRAAFAKGTMALPLTERQSQQRPMSWTTYKMRMVNHYGPVPKNASKLDFTWFEYPVERFEEIVADYLQFWEDFKARNGGFEPTGAATYFVQRIPEKPHGWFSQQGKGFDHPGLSFTLDPVHHDPSEPAWALFLKESIAFALAHGGRVALTQTRFVTREDYFAAPGNVALEDAPNHRFTSAFFEQFLAAPEPSGAAGAGATTTHEKI